MARKMKRDAVIVATKVAGPSGGWFRAPVRGGQDRARPPLRSSAPSTPACGGSAPTTSTSTRRTGPTRTCRSKRRWRRSTRVVAGGQGARTSAAATRRPTGSPRACGRADAHGLRALRDDPEQLQPAEPPLRGRARRRVPARAGEPARRTARSRAACSRASTRTARGPRARASPRYRDATPRTDGDDARAS